MHCYVQKKSLEMTIRLDETRPAKTRHGKARQGKTRQGKARQGKTMDDKTRLDKVSILLDYSKMPQTIALNFICQIS